MAYYFSCPSCKKSDRFRVVKEQGSLLPYALFFFGQWLGALVFLGSRQGRVQCGDCHFIFRQPHLPRSDVAKFAGWIFFVLGLGALAMFLAAIGVIDSSRLPEFEIVLKFESFLSSHLRLFAYVTSSVFVLLIASCVVGATTANNRFRRSYPHQLQAKESDAEV